MSTEPRPHAPKIAALIALAEDRLSPSARARIERHLEGCPTCRSALAAIVLHERIAEDARQMAPPELDFARMELALEHEARAIAAQQREARGEARASAQRATFRRRGAIAATLALAAAAVLGVIAARPWARPELASSDGAPREGSSATASPASDALAARPSDAPEAAPPATPLTATVTLVAGRGAEVVSDTDGAPRSVALDDELSEATTLRTDGTSEVHVRLAAGAGLALHPATELDLVRLRRASTTSGEHGEVELALRAGRLAVTAGGPLFTAESRFVVITAEHRFALRISRAELELDPNGVVRLAVAEGDVEVRDHADQVLELVRGPARWSSERAAGPPRVGTPHGIDGESAGGSILQVTHPALVRWQVGEVTAEGAGELRMRVDAGRVAIAGFDGAGRAFRRVVEVGGDGVSIGPGELEAEPPRVRQGYLPESEIREVVRRGLVRLRQCYEQGLRERPDLEGRLTVRITVGLDGSVSRARVQGGDVPDGLQQCVRSYAERWTFPPPRGGFVTFDVPLAFSARR